MENKTVKFIQLSGIDDKKERRMKLEQSLSIPNQTIRRYISEIDYFLDFLLWWDAEYHEIVQRVPDLKEKEKGGGITFFGAVLHSYLASDIYTLILLLSNGLYHQANVILRRTIEYTLYSIWLDLISKYGHVGIFENIYWDPQLWKPLLRGQRLKDGEVNKKLKKVYDANKTKNESLRDFKKRFFIEGNEVDFFMLFLKPACENCITKYNLKEIIKIDHTPSDPRDDDIEPKFKPTYIEEGVKCDYCNGVAPALVLHIPEIDTIHLILKKYFADETQNDLSEIMKIYNILSNHFVHFSVEVPTDQRKNFFDMDNKKINLLGFKGTEYVFEKLSSILCNYFILMRGEFKIEHGECDVKKVKFKRYVSR